MIKKISLAIVLIFLITGIGFAFQNEPDGFRGLKWGDAPTEDMIFLHQVVENRYFNNGNYYYKGLLVEKLHIGSAKINHISYIFNLYSNQFYKVNLFFNGEPNFEILKMICEGKYGEPTHEDKYFLRWVGDKAGVSLYFNPKKKEGLFAIESTEIHSESPEDNKQKEVEKAEEDF
jgi:hypothetical protein